MIKSINTANAAAPFSAYSQAVEIPASARHLSISGQVGVTASGELPDDPIKQHEIAWQNIFSILDAANMDKADIVEVLAVVTDHQQVSTYRDIRDKMLEGHLCASTIMVCGLANPKWKVEIAVRAACVDGS